MKYGLDEKLDGLKIAEWSSRDSGDQWLKV